MQKILLDTVIIAALIFTGVYLYRTYGDDVRALFHDEYTVIFINNLAIKARLADTEAKRVQGLSNTERLDELEGMLFILEGNKYPRIWMKDMRYPIDIFFIDENFTIVEIAENVVPESYPTEYTSTVPVRFVLETNAFVAKSFKIEVGDMVTIPPRELPSDLRERLRTQQ